MIALVGLGDQFVDLAVGDLGQDAVAFADGQQDRIQHLVDALHHFAMDALKLVGLAALVETALARRLHQAQDLLRHPLHLHVRCFRCAARAGALNVRAVFQNGCTAVAGVPRLFLSVYFTYHRFCFPFRMNAFVGVDS